MSEWDNFSRFFFRLFPGINVTHTTGVLRHTRKKLRIRAIRLKKHEKVVTCVLIFASTDLMDCVDKDLRGDCNVAVCRSESELRHVFGTLSVLEPDFKQVEQFVVANTFGFCPIFEPHEIWNENSSPLIRPMPHRL